MSRHEPPFTAPQPDILRMLAQMDTRQARIEAMLVQIMGAKSDPVDHDLLQVIGALQWKEGFCAAA